MRSPAIAERLALAQLLKIDPALCRHRVHPDAFDLAHGASHNSTLTIPQGYFFAITNVEVIGYPLDVAGNYLMGDRQEGAPFDTVTFQWFLNGEAQTPATEYRFYLGEVLLIFTEGELKLTVSYNILPLLLGSAPSQRLYLRLHGYFVPCTAAATSEGGGAGVSSVPNELAQGPVGLASAG